jgi:ribose 5-phosphate isomerase B
MKIYIASDHAGFEMKRELIEHLSLGGYEVYDCGPEKYDHDDDYPDYISIAAKEVSKSFDSKTADENSEETKIEINKSKDSVMGIVIGYSGQGEAMVANRFPHIRAAVYYGGPKHIITLSREHNDANILSLGAHFITTQEAKEAVGLWLNTKFSGEERHVRRIDKIEKFK